MPDFSNVTALWQGNSGTDTDTGGPPLAGTQQNGARDPKRKTPPGSQGSLGDKAFMDSLLIVVVAWVVLLFLALSLRHHNI